MSKRPIHIDLTSDDDVEFKSKRQCREYVLRGLEEKLPKHILDMIRYKPVAGQSGPSNLRINTALLSDVFNISIGNFISSQGQSDSTLDSIIAQIVSQIKAQQQAVRTAESQIADAVRARRLPDIVHYADGAILRTLQNGTPHEHGPPLSMYPSYMLQPVINNPDFKRAGDSLLNCLPFISNTDDTKAILYHGTTANCKDGLCKLFPAMGAPEGSLGPGRDDAYGPGFYMTPYFYIALHYACRRARERNMTEAIVLEMGITSDPAKIKPYGAYSGGAFGGDCKQYIVIRTSHISALQVIRVHHFSRKEGKWCR